MDSELKKKQQRIRELGDLINLHGQTITHETKAKVQELQDRLTFRLEKLECEGADIKIGVMSEVLEILKKDKLKIK